MNRVIRCAAMAAVVALACGSAAQAVDIQTVSVGNPGNPDDTHGDGYGGVDYEYRIGTFEVTAGQYTAFLNAVAETDTYGLYNTDMSWGCGIQRSGLSGSYAYSVAIDWGDRPVTHVSWGDAARFANWLHNGQPTGTQDFGTTEDGSYLLAGAMTDTQLLAVTRKLNATWVIPSEDEWYKAAYHYNDGVTGSYWDYPTESNAVPTGELPPGTDMVNGSANYDWAVGGTTDVGAYTAKPSDSAYGTFDQGGNMFEWNEAVIGGLNRGARGGSYNYPYGSMLAGIRASFSPTSEHIVGFRVAEVPKVEIQTVRVGNPGNEGELSGVGAGGFGPDRICGAVDYVYNIGTFEVTAGEYTEFLNAVADDDPYGLYNPSMWTSDYGCKIERTGSSPNFSYSVAGDWADRPVNFVSWGDAARFANWLHNGQPTGAQDLTTTEDGSYYLNGATNDAALLAVVREEDATWVIPSEDEWYKGAYHYNDGVTANYYDYATSSDTVPGYVDNSGNLSGTGEPFTEGGTDPGNYATWDDDDSPWAIGSPYYRTVAGEWENSESPYGTFDQCGNVGEWHEGILLDSRRGYRDGSFAYGWGSIRAAVRSSLEPTSEGPSLGFRVATFADCNGNSIPDECDLDCGATSGLGGGLCNDLYPAPACGQSHDDNGDGIPDECGACCATPADVACTQRTQTLCEGGGGVYVGDGTACEALGCPIPTVSEWGLVAMALLVLAAGTLVWARRGPATA